MINFFRKHESFSIAIITAFCYVATFYYEKGYADYFGIPNDFITITPLAMIVAAISITIFIGFCFMILSLPLTIMINSKKSYVRAILITSPILILAMANDYLKQGIHLSKLAIYLVIYIIILISLWLLASKSGKTTHHSVINDENNTTYPPSKPIMDKCFSLLTTVVILRMVFDLISGCGFYAARTKSDFDSFTKDNVNYIIVKIYNENIFIKRIDNGKINNTISIFKPDDLKNITIKRTKLKWVEKQSNYFLY